MTEGLVGPVIEGLKFVRYLEKGGYSHVYEYERKRPKMRVAVKVLDDSRLSDSQLAQFAAEAETMAELADHPYIVQVFNTGTTDAGQPYVVMKFFSGKNLGARAATTRFAVAEVLRIAIQITSAVETAHRAGILHRDIKPANVLMDSHDWPGLADFGIAGRLEDTDDDDDLGVSIPWSPPEVLSGASNGSVASDVYSLAATFWHLLAGRSPFEVPGGDNSNRALMGRVLRSAPPATGRADAPASLDRLLQQAMSKNPAQRPGSALELARALQIIEQEQRYARTEIIVEGSAPSPELRLEPPQQPHRSTDNSHFAPPVGEHPSGVPPAPGPAPTSVRPSRPTSRPGSASAQPAPSRPSPVPIARSSVPLPPRPPTAPSDGTKRRPATSTSPSGPTPASPAPPSREPSGTSYPKQAGGLARPSLNPTERRPQAASTDNSAAAAPTRRGVKPSVVAAIAVALLLVVAVVGILVSGSSSKGGQTAATHKPAGNDQGGFGSGDVVPPAVTSTFSSSKKTVTFRWALPSGSPAGVQFSYSINGGQQVGPTPKTSVSVPATDPSGICILVASVDSSGSHHLAATECGHP